MINAIAKRIANYVCHNTESSDDKLYNYEIYVYGFEIILSSIVAFGIVLLFGLLLDKLMELIVFFLCFYFIRQRTGGYHADTYFKCNLIFTLNIAIVALIISVETAQIYQVIFNGISFAICSLLTFMKAPISNPNKPIVESKRKTFKITAFILVLISELISITIINIYSYSMSISLALFSVSVAMMINSKTKEGVNK